MQLMLQATVCDCLALDPFAFEEDGLSASEVDVGRGKVVEALVIAGMVVVRHEGGDLAFEIAGKVVVLKQDAVLERLMPALDLALSLRMIRGAADVFHLLAIQPLREILRDVSRSVIRQQARSVNNGHLIETAGRQRQIEGAVTSFAFMVAQSFQATMKREKSSSTVER